MTEAQVRFAQLLREHPVTVQYSYGMNSANRDRLLSIDDLREAWGGPVYMRTRSPTDRRPLGSFLHLDHPKEISLPSMFVGSDGKPCPGRQPRRSLYVTKRGWASVCAIHWGKYNLFYLINKMDIGAVALGWCTTETLQEFFANGIDMEA